MKEYSIIIPAYNESDKITSTLTQINTFMKEFAQSFEIIVVDDGSSDNTTKRVEDYVVQNENIILVKNPHKGKGVAIWTGVMKAAGQYIYLCDADLSTPISELKKLSVWIKEQGFDIVIASREGHGSQRIGEPLYRHVMGRVFNLFVQVVAVWGVNDTQCGFKLFNGASAKLLFSKLSIYNPNSELLKNAYVGAYDVEVLYLARKLGMKIKEVPVVWRFVKTTRIRPIHDSLKMIKDVFSIRLNDFKGVYKNI